jgi:hypothetical protein
MRIASIVLVPVVSSEGEVVAQLLELLLAVHESVVAAVTNEVDASTLIAVVEVVVMVALLILLPLLLLLLLLLLPMLPLLPLVPLLLLRLLAAMTEWLWAVASEAVAVASEGLVPASEERVSMVVAAGDVAAAVSLDEAAEA